MKILFSPSESKSDIAPFLPSQNFTFASDLNTNKRFEFIAKIFNEISLLDKKLLLDLFGIKDEKLLQTYIQNPLNNKTQKAILRYTGIAYKALNYETLDKLEQIFIDENTIIFSNLFGPLLAKDLIPNYKLKQGKNPPNINIANFYKTNYKNTLDDFLKNEFIVDLRAKFYEKFYTLDYPNITFRFFKENKQINHYSKLYRGILLRQIAQNKLHTKDALLSFLDKNYDIIDTKQNKNQTIIDINIKD